MASVTAPAWMGNDSSLADGKILDLAILEDVFRGNNKKIRAMLSRFVLLGGEIVGEVTELAASGNWTALCEASHKLRSSALTIGAVGLAQACDFIEEAAASNDRARLEAASMHLAVEFERASRAIDALPADAG